MRDLLLRMLPVLRLTRVSGAFAAIGNVWFVVLWTRANPGEDWSRVMNVAPLWTLLAGAAVAALGLFAFGASINDVVDASRDRALRRDRPLASGGASEELAVFLAAGTLIIAVLGATVFGTGAVVATLGLAGLILAYNGAGKFVPGLGFPLLAAIYAGHMLAPNLGLKFVLPIWLVMTHALVVAGLAHRLGRRSPPLSRRGLGLAIAGWVVATIILGVLSWRRVGGLLPGWVDASALLWPAILMLLYAALVTRRVLQVGPGSRLGSKIERYGALWLPLYGAAWLASGEHWVGAGVMAGVAAAGLAGMTILRELFGLAEHPVGFRV